MKLLFENWRQYLKEGKAIKVNPSMRHFAEGVIEAYNKEGSLKFDEPFFTGTIKGYEEEDIEVKAVLYKTENPRMNGRGAVAKETLGTQNQIFKLFQMREEPVLGEDALKGLVLHELIHVIDPKFKLDPEHPQRQIHRDPVKYFNSPHEQDAFMRQSVEDIKSYYGKITKEMIQNYKPEPMRQWEKVWHETNPKAWRKFLNTLYAEVEEE